MTNQYRRGFFIQPNGTISPGTNIPSGSQGWLKKAVVKITQAGEETRFLNKFGSTVRLLSGATIRFSKEGNAKTTAGSFPHNTSGIPFQWEVRSVTGGQGQAVYHFFKNDEFQSAGDASGGGRRIFLKLRNTGRV